MIGLLRQHAQGVRLGIATVLYVLVGFVLVGLVSYTLLDVADPLGVALDGAGLHWVARVVDFGATLGLAASVMALCKTRPDLPRQRRTPKRSSSPDVLWRYVAVAPRITSRFT